MVDPKKGSADRLTAVSVRAGTLSEIREKGVLTVSGGGTVAVVFYHEGRLYAVDNRCPHMGFPLSRRILLLATEQRCAEPAGQTAESFRDEPSQPCGQSPAAGCFSDWHTGGGLSHTISSANYRRYRSIGEARARN